MYNANKFGQVVITSAAITFGIGVGLYLLQFGVSMIGILASSWIGSLILAIMIYRFSMAMVKEENKK